MADETVVDSSPTEEVASPDISEYSDEQYKEWRLTGKQPKAESAPAPEPEATGDVEPSESTPDKQGKPKAKTEQRFQDLLKERKAERERADRLEAELKTLREKSVKPESPPEPKEPKSKLVPPIKPLAKDFDHLENGYDKWIDAKDKYYEDLADYKAQKAVEDFKADAAKQEKDKTVAQQNQEIEKQFKEKVAKAQAKYDDWGDVVQDIPFTAGGVADAFVLDSDISGELLYYFGKHKDEAAEIDGLAPFKATRKLIEIEKQLSNGKEKPAKPVVTKASPPPSELGRGASPVDPEAEIWDAVAANDGDRYIELQNRRELAKLRGR